MTSTPAARSSAGESGGRRAQGVDPKRRLRGLVHRRHQQPRLGLAQLRPPHPRQPLGVGVGDRRARRRRVVEAREQLVALGRGAAQQRVDESRSGAGAPVRGAAAPGAVLGELDGLIDGGVVGGLGLEELEQAEPQRGERRGVDAAAAPAGEHPHEVVGGAAPLHRAVSQAARLRELARVQLQPRRRRPRRRGRSTPRPRTCAGGSRRRAGGPASPRRSREPGRLWPRR